MPGSSDRILMRTDPYKRVILHIDLDCFYAQVESLRLGVGPGVPLAVQQWNSLIAVNYPARDAGVKRHTSVPEALLKCPQLRLVHVPVYSVEALQKESVEEGDDEIVVARPRYHDEMPSFRPDGTRLPPQPPPPGSNKACLEPYRQASMSIFRLLKDWCSQEAPGAVLEKGGLDEAFVDITEAVEEQLIDEFAEKYTILRDDLAEEALSEESIDDYSAEFIDQALNWDGLGESVNVPITEATDESLRLQMKLGELRIWKGCQLAKSLRSRLRSELNFIASIGIGPNKMLAKLISALHKPDKQTRILPGQVEKFMCTVPFEKIRLMGGKMGQRVLEKAEEDGHDADDGDDFEEADEEEPNTAEVIMASDLWPLSVAELVERVGDRQTAAWIYNLIRGRDDSPCTPRSLTKSFMSAKSFRPSIKDWPELHDWCVVLCGELWSRLQEERELSNRWPATLTIHFRAFNKFGPVVGIKRQWSNVGAQTKSCEFPKSSHPDPLVVKLIEVLNSVFKLLRAAEALFPMSRLAVSVHNFKPLDAQGRAKLTRVDQFFTPTAANDSFELPPSKASLFEDVEKKAPAAPAPAAKKTKTSVLEMLQARASASDKGAEKVSIEPQIKMEKKPPPVKSVGSFFKYKCPKCKFTCAKDDNSAIQEHSDYHLALELSRT